MTDDSQDMPKGDGNCIALHKEGSQTGKRCEWPARFLRGELLCVRHAKALNRDHNWPLDKRFENHREQILHALRAELNHQTGKRGQRTKSNLPLKIPKSQNGESKDALTGLLKWLSDAKILGTVLVALAAFVSEFLFLLPFDIDYSFFISTAESIPLFIRNLAFILIVCVIMFAILCIVIVILETRSPAIKFAIATWHDEKRRTIYNLISGLKIVWESKNVIEKRLQNLKAQLAKNQATLDGIESNPTTSYLRAQIGRGAATQYVLLRLVEEYVSDRIPFIGPSLTNWIQKWKRRRNVAPQDAGVDIWVDHTQRILESRREELQKESEQLSYAIANMASQFVNLQKSLRRDLVSFINNVGKTARGFFKSYTNALHDEFFVIFPPKFITQRKWAQISLVLIVLLIPPIMRYLDGKTMVVCARSLMGPQALVADQVCPPDGSIDWLTYVGIDVNNLKVSDFDIEPEIVKANPGKTQQIKESSYVMYRLLERWAKDGIIEMEISDPEGRGDNENTEEIDATIMSNIIAQYGSYGQYLGNVIEDLKISFKSIHRAAYRSIYGFLREYSPLAHNYPIVSVTFKDSPSIYRQDANVLGMQTVCQPIATNIETQSGALRVNQEQTNSGNGVGIRSRSVKVGSPAGGLTRSRFVTLLSSDDACQLVDGKTSARMLYLGEAGAWTLLYSLGPDGSPIFFKTEDITSISYKPVAIESKSVEDKGASDGLFVSVGSIEVPQAPLDVRVGPIEASLQVDQTLLNAANSISNATGEIAVKLGDLEASLNEVSHRIDDVKVALIGSNDQWSIDARLAKSNRELTNVMRELRAREGQVSIRLDKDLGNFIEQRLFDVYEIWVSIEKAIRVNPPANLEAVRQELEDLRSQIGGPKLPSLQSPDWQGMGGVPTGKLETMPSDVAQLSQPPSDPTAEVGMDTKQNAQDIFDQLGSVNTNLETIAKLVTGIQSGGAGDANLDLPAIFIGVEKRIDKRCFKRDVEAAFPFMRNQRRIEPFDSHVEKNLNFLVGRVRDEAKKLPDTPNESGEPNLLLVLVEGTADTTGSPQINRDISEARASFIQDLIEKRLDDGKTSGDWRFGSGKDVTDKVVIASYGTGEWSYRVKSQVDLNADQARFFKPRSVLVRLCPLPLQDESDPANTSGIQSTTNLTDEPASAE